MLKCFIKYNKKEQFFNCQQILIQIIISIILTTKQRNVEVGNLVQ